MNKIYLFALYAIVVISLGNAGGAGLAQNRDFTGSPVSVGTCNNCHAGGNFSPMPVIEVLDEGVAVTQYVPGQTYNVRLTIEASNFPSAFGFQMVSLDNSNNDGGKFGMTPTGTRIIKVNNRSYFEQERRLGVNQWEIPWTAPEAGGGDISMYAVGNAVNANGNTSGDIAGATSITLLEDQSSSTTSTSLERQIELFPVPVRSNLTIDLKNLQSSFTSVEIVDMQGRTKASSLVPNLELNHLSPGTYLAVIRLNDEIAVKRFVKI